MSQSETINDQPPSSNRLGTTVALGLVVTTALIVAAWFGTFQRVWIQWFPAWWMRDLPLLDRLTGGDSYYTHGPIVPVVSLLVAIYIYSRVGLPTERTRVTTAVGWLVFLFFLGTHLLFTYASVTFASGFSLLGVLAGLLLIWGGRPMLKAYALPVALLFFMIPLPLTWIDGINFGLKLFATRAALWLAIHVFKVPAVVDGSFVLLSPDASGVPKTLVIENVCGGLRSIIALTYFAALFAALCRAKGGWRWVLLVLAFPVAIASNVVRITSLIVAAHHLGTEAAGEHGWFHDLSGILVFGLALAFMFLIESGILLVGHVLKRDWSDARLLGYLGKIPTTAYTRPRLAHPGAMIVLAVAAALCTYWNFRPEPAPMGGVATKAIPESITLNQTRYTGESLKLDDKVLAILETDDYVYRRYIPENGRGPHFDLLIVFSKNNRRGTHSPELCIQGSGERILDKGPVRITTEQPINGRSEFEMRKVLSQDNRRSVYYLYVFKCGDRYTTNYTLQQASILLAGLFNRDATGALIRLTVPLEKDDLEGARRLAHEAAAKLMPLIDEKLP